MNWIKTFLLMGLLTAIVVGVGYAWKGPQGMMFAFILAFAMNFVSYWYSDKIVLTMYRAQPVAESDAPGLYSMVAGLTKHAGLPMPKLYMVDMDNPNAFATGRDPDHAAVVVTSGLMRILGSDEVEGVIAHELGHVKNRDILIGTMAATLAGAVMMAASMMRWAMILGGFGGRDDRRGGGIAMLALIILAPIAALMVQMAISRSREYQADATGAQMSGKPLSLANALLKLECGNEAIPADVQPATAHMFIVNPLRGGIGSLFSTHPPIPDRVERLQMMAGQSPLYFSGK